MVGVSVVGGFNKTPAELAVEMCSENFKKAQKIFLKQGKNSDKVLQPEILLKMKLLFKDFFQRIMSLKFEKTSLFASFLFFLMIKLWKHRNVFLKYF